MHRILKIFLRTLLFLFVLVNIIVIFNAYKFTHYYETGDKSVIPQAQKSSWDKMQDIFFGMNAAKKREPLPDSTMKDVQLITKDNIRLDAWNVKVPNPMGTVILFHGHGGTKADVLPQARVFELLGYNCLLVDFRAHGKSGGNTTTIGYKESEDVKTAYEFVARSGEKKIILYGISLGAATIIKAINDFNLQPQKIILDMPFGSIEDAVAGRVKMMHLPAQPLSTLLTFWGGTIHGFWAFSMKPTEYAKKIKCPVLLQWGKNDLRVSEKETDAIFKNISTPKKLVIYEKSGHQNLAENESQKWQENVTAFLK